MNDKNNTNNNPRYLSPMIPIVIALCLFFFGCWGYYLGRTDGAIGVYQNKIAVVRLPNDTYYVCDIATTTNYRPEIKEHRCSFQIPPVHQK